MLNKPKIDVKNGAFVINDAVYTPLGEEAHLIYFDTRSKYPEILSTALNGDLSTLTITVTPNEYSLHLDQTKDEYTFISIKYDQHIGYMVEAERYSIRAIVYPYNEFGHPNSQLLWERKDRFS